MSAHDDHEHGGPGYASPQAAREQPPEKFVYVASLYEGTGIDKPDVIAMIQNSLDGDRVYVTNSLFSTWDKPVLSGDQGLAHQAERPERRHLCARSGLLRRLPRAGGWRASARDSPARRGLHY